MFVKLVEEEFKQPLVLDYLPSDDEWITKEEEPALPTDDSWINDFDRAARRLAREMEQCGSLDVDTNLDDNDPQDENDGDNEVDGTFVDSNEVKDEDDDVQMGATPTTTGTDMENDDFDACTNFGFDE